MTWNIHGGIGPDRTHDLDRIIKLITSHKPDIVALQELDSRGGRGANGLPLAYIADAVGAHVAEARTIVAPDGHYGHALISRWPMTSVVLHDISVGKWERRYAIEANVETPHGPVHVSAAHLGLWFTERRHQAAKLARIANSTKPLSIMLGDFNDWRRRGPVERALAGVLPARTVHRTFPARWPLFVLDRIYCRPGAALLSSWVDTEGRRASDHLPVFADIALKI
jgi:endonuclease/exonuclease/phosphatase family metal-dependent hydrolase